MSDNPTVEAGTLRHSITIQKPSATRDAVGQIGATWVDVLSARAAITSTSGPTFKSSFQNNTLASNATDCITIRYPGTSIPIAPGMQIVCGDNAYLIQAVDDVKRHHVKLVMACLGIDTVSA